MSKKLDYFLKKYTYDIENLADKFKDAYDDNMTIGISEARDRIINWLRNFENIKYYKFEHPFHLLKNIEYYKISEKIAEIIRNINKKNPSFLKNDKTYIAPLGEIQESSFRITSNSFHGYPNYSGSIVQLLDNISTGKGKDIVFFDDFVNSGGQIKSIFGALFGETTKKSGILDEIEKRANLNKEQIKKIKEAKLHIYCIQAFSDNVSETLTELKKEYSLKIEFHPFLATTENESIFGDSRDRENIAANAQGIIKGKAAFTSFKYQELHKFYNILKDVGELLLRKNEPSWNETKYKNRALGYGNSCKAIISDHNVPTVTVIALCQGGIIRYNKIQVEWRAFFHRKKKILMDRKPIKRKKVYSDANLKKQINELKKLYENGEISDGRKKSEQYFYQSKINPILLKHVIRFNLRDRNWLRVKSIIKGVIEKRINDEIRAMCHLYYIECLLREANKDKLNRNNFEKVIISISEELSCVPKSQTNTPQFHYIKGRYFLEVWWSNRNPKKSEYLEMALNEFETSLKFSNWWWVQCYKCIVLKLLKKSEFENHAKAFKRQMLKKFKEKPNQPSVRTYVITALLLSEDTNTIVKFLKSFTQKMASTDFEDSLLHKIEMIYHHNKRKQTSYKRIVTNWIKNIPRI